MLSEPQWAIVFGAAKRRGARWSDLADVDAFKREVEGAIGSPIETPPAASSVRRLGPQGTALMHSFEGCRLEAYPDPGSKDGHPWTIGWGATGAGIAKGVVWTQAQADARFVLDIDKTYGAAVNKMLGDTPTTQAQFDAMVSLAYNIGVSAFQRSTVLREHKKGNHTAAARAFLLWNKNDSKVMRGLTRRRMAESDLYLST